MMGWVTWDLYVIDENNITYINGCKTAELPLPMINV